MTARSSAKTIAEKILSVKAGREAVAGDVLVCDVDVVLGTDASSPMAIDYFRQMGGRRLFDASRVAFSLDHYSPPTTPRTLAFHDEVRQFAAEHGATVFDVGDGISHQVVMELGRARPGGLIIGADSHTVTCGALNLFATGLGSSDLAAAFITGKAWLRVPESIAVRLSGDRPHGLAAKDIALALIHELGSDGANYQCLEFSGSAVPDLSIDDRMVICNLAVEADAKASIFPCDAVTIEYLTGRGADRAVTPIAADPDAQYIREVAFDLSRLSPRVALPHQPDHVVPIEQAVGTPIDMVFLGTCTGGRVRDFHDALAILRRGGSRVAHGVQLVVTPASREVHDRLVDDGSLEEFAAMGAIITTTGCGACCGTSGVIPGDGMRVMSTANRNFKARMGNATAEIYLASPASCAAAAVTGRITDPRSL